MGRGLLIGLLMVMVVLLAGCINEGDHLVGSQLGNLGSAAKNYDNIEIKSFWVQTTPEGNVKLKLILEDTKTGRETWTDGTAKVKITVGEKYGDPMTVWEGTFKISSNSFTKLETVDGDIMAYWEAYIKKEEIKSPKSSGEAYIELTLPNGRTISKKAEITVLPVTYRLPPAQIRLNYLGGTDTYTIRIGLYDKYGTKVMPSGILTVAILANGEVLLNESYNISEANYSLKDTWPYISLTIPKPQMEDNVQRMSKTLRVTFETENATVEAEYEIPPWLDP